MGQLSAGAGVGGSGLAPEPFLCPSGCWSSLQQTIQSALRGRLDQCLGRGSFSPWKAGSTLPVLSSPTGTGMGLPLPPSAHPPRPGGTDSAPASQLQSTGGKPAFYHQSCRAQSTLEAWVPIPGSLSSTHMPAARDAREEDPACPGPRLPRRPTHLNSVITEAVSMLTAGPLPWNPNPLPSPGALCSLSSSSPARKQWAPSLSTGVAGREGALRSLLLAAMGLRLGAYLEQMNMRATARTGFLGTGLGNVKCGDSNSHVYGAPRASRAKAVHIC